MARIKKKVPEREPYWHDLISVWFSFCRDKFNLNPDFTGSAPRDLKSIVKALHERASKQGVEWTLDTARHRLQKFLENAFTDNWLRNNWLLSNINRQKDRLFFHIQKIVAQTTNNPFE